MVTYIDRLFNNRKPRRSATIESLDAVSLDLELTGLDERRDAIVSIGAVKMSGGRILLTDTFYRLVNPKIPLCGPSITIHGITPSDVQASKGIEEVLQELIDFCGDGVIIGHCVDIDLAFLGRETKRLTGRPFRNKSIDTLAVYKWLSDRHYHSDSISLGTNPSLYEIAKHFAIPASVSHNAIMDAYITAQLFQRFIAALACCGVERIGDLLRIGNQGGAIKSGEFSNF
ncbi:MAG: 3'-5' exonuclease [Nitrospirae bacterium]|nr:3'-5' exonuclease [Nitrospirota bacterium]